MLTLSPVVGSGQKWSIIVINVTYRAVDGAKDKRTFKTLKGAQKFAREMVGDHPEMGSDYAVSGDGIGRVRVTGCTLQQLFNVEDSDFNNDAQEYRKATTERRIELEDKWGERASYFQADPLEDIFADFIRQEANLPEGM